MGGAEMADTARCRAAWKTAVEAIVADAPPLTEDQAVSLRAAGLAVNARSAPKGAPDTVSMFTATSPQGGRRG